MRKWFYFVLIFLAGTIAQAQTASDLFDPGNTTPISYLGIDFSHVKLIGNFSEFMEAGEKDALELRNEYFPRWNMVVVNEREKYDIRGMLRKSNIYYDIDMIMGINARASVEEMKSYNADKFTEEDLQSFVAQYNLEGKEGIGVVFIAESLNKSALEAVFHFVAINMTSGNILFHRRLRGEPQGFGLRNYWINSLYKIIRNIKYYYYYEWRMNAKPDGMQV